MNDADGLLCNVWRAIKAEPDAVAEWADYPIHECDLHARHLWLVERKESLQARLEGNPDYFDAKIAGWYLWGLSLWIGSGFCSGDGPWQVVEAEDGSRQLVHLGDAGQGVSRQLVHLGDAGQGVSRQRVHLGNAGQGVKRKLVAGSGECGLLAWMQALGERLRRVRVCCGDWTRVCGGDSGDALRHFFAGGEPCGLFLDPPYSDAAGRDSTIYRKEDLQVAHAVRAWCLRHGDDRHIRIVLSGYEGEGHEELEKHGWRKVAWKAQGGMASVAGGESQAKKNCRKEKLWISPHCLKPALGFIDQIRR